MEASTENKELKVINTSLEVFRTAPQILKANQDRSAKAKAIGQSILEQWQQAWAMENEDDKLKALAAADERSNNYLVKCAGALKEEKEARAAITQMMDLFKKLFTEAEADLDKTKAGTTTAKVQENRDNYVSESFKVQERKRKEAERVAEKAKEAITLKANTEKSLHSGFAEYLLSKKQKLQGALNNLVLGSFADGAAAIRLYHPKFTTDQFGTIVATTGYFNYHTKEEVSAIVIAVREELYSKCQAKYIEEMTALKAEVVDKISSKHEELKEQKRLADEAAETKRLAAEAAKKDKAEADRLQAIADKAEADRKQAIADQQKREEEEQAELAKQANAQKQEAEQAIDIKAQGEQTMVLFEQEAAIAVDTPAPSARQGYEIVLLHPVGATQIFSLWFENEGKNLPIDKILNTKIDQMKSWAEKHAHKTGTKIDSKFLKYEDSFKALNKKIK